MAKHTHVKNTGKSLLLEKFKEGHGLWHYYAPKQNVEIESEVMVISGLTVKRV